MGDILEKVKGIFQTSNTFLQEVWIELKKVSWPTKKEATAQTYAVIVTVIVIAIFLGLADWFFKFVLIDTLMK